MQLFSTVSERIQNLSKVVLAYGLLSLVFCLEIVLFPAPFHGLNTLPYLISLVFILALYNPTLISPFFMAGIGILLDVLMGMPVGMNALVFLLLFWLTTLQSSFLLAQSFVIQWMIFGVVHASILTLQWMIFSAISLAPLHSGDLLWQSMIGCLTFPILFWFYAPLRRLDIS